MVRFAALCLLSALSLPAQIQYIESRKIWLLSTSGALCHGAGGRWRAAPPILGAPIWRADDLWRRPRPGYLSFDPRQMLEAEGSRLGRPPLQNPRSGVARRRQCDLVLRYVSHRIQQNEMDIVLKDLNDGVEAALSSVSKRESCAAMRRFATARPGR